MPKDFLALDTNFPSFTGTETTDQKVDQLYNYTYMLLENLRYCLRNLDSGNFNEAGLREITEPIYADIQDADGNITKLAIEATGLALRVSNAEGDITNLTVTAQGLQSQVTNIDGDVSNLQQTATSLTSQISSVEGDISVLQQTDSSLTSRISSAEGNISTLQQTDSSLTSRISTAEGNISSLQQTSASFSTRITNAEGNISSLSQTVNSLTLSVSNGATSSWIYLDAGDVEMGAVKIQFTGVVYFSDLNGSAGTIINGGAIDTETLYLDSLYGATIYLCDAYGDVAAELTTTAASSWSGRKLEIESGAIEMNSKYGDIFLSTASGVEIHLDDGDGEVAIRGDLVPASSDNYRLGAPGLVWSDVYAASGTVSTSDREQKEAIVYGLYKLDGLLDKLEPCTFRFRDGTSGRSHAGFIAQDVEAALEELGLTTADFAGLVKSPREDGGYDYFLRYNEFIPINTWEIQKLKARVAELEARLGSQTEA